MGFVIKEDKVLLSINLSVKDKEKIIRLVDKERFLLVDPQEIRKIMKSVGFESHIINKESLRITRDLKKKLIILGIKK